MKKNNWFITINKEKDNDFFYTIEDILSSLSNYQIFGILHNKESNPHYHIYIYFINGVKFDTLKRLFPTSHIEECFGTRQQVYSYLLHNNVDKNPYNEEDIFTNVDDLSTFILSKENNKESIYLDMIAMLSNGCSVIDVLKKYPTYCCRINVLKSLRDEINSDLIDKSFNSNDIG